MEPRDVDLPRQANQDGANGHQMRSGLAPIWPSVVLILAASILVLPLWYVTNPAMPDYPAHLASYYLISGGANSSPLSEFYGVAWAPIPNLAGEIIVPTLALIFPLEVATKIFLSFAVMMWVVGPGLINRALFGRIGIAPLVATAFAYNANFMWGFLNYYFAAGLCFIFFAGWIASEAWPRWPRLLIFSGAVTILYFCHLVGAALLLLLISAFEVDDPRLTWRSARTIAVNLAVISLPVALLFLTTKLGTAIGGETDFNVLDTLQSRVESLLQTSFGKPAGVYILSIALLFAWATWRHRIVIHPRMRLALCAVAFAALLLPENAMGVWGGHLRVPAFAAAMLFAACDMKLSRPLAFALGGAVLATLILLSSTTVRQWKVFDRRMEEFRAALRNLPSGTQLMTAMGPDVPREPLYWHVAEFAIIDSSAFTAQLFAWGGGWHIIYLKPAVAAFASHSSVEGMPTKVSFLNRLAAGGSNNPHLNRYLCARWHYLFFFTCHYDTALIVHRDEDATAAPIMLTPIHQGTFFSLYRIQAAHNCTSSRRVNCENNELND